MGFNIINEPNGKLLSDPLKVETINKGGIFINGEVLNGVIDYKIVSPAPTSTELTIRISVRTND